MSVSGSKNGMVCACLPSVRCVNRTSSGEPLAPNGALTNPDSLQPTIRQRGLPGKRRELYR
jgi:hypothetical protein